ncbi:MAG: SurA N-terminal domain-containing protein [Defluviitaleaceae bacterium]|nr:SurA N-terminal domain-containing protein [Defluviitaleaceae bacterium]
MAKNQTKRRDNSIKIAVMIFVAFILVVGTGLIINNRAVSYVATVDGTRIPISHFNYQWHQLLEDEQVFELIGWLGWDFVDDAALHGMVELHAVTARADELDVSLSREQIDAVTQSARADFDSGDFFSEIGFSRSSFVDFMLMMALYNEIYVYITSQYEVPETVTANALAEYIWENIDRYTTAFVFAVQVDSEEEANELFARFVDGEAITDILYELDETNDDGEVIIRNAANTHLHLDDFLELLEMGVGDFTEVIGLRDGLFGFFQIERLEIEEPSEETIETISAQAEWAVRHEHFRNFADLWVDQATVARNTRVLPYPPEIEWDFDDILEDLEIEDLGIDE